MGLGTVPLWPVPQPPQPGGGQGQRRPHARFRCRLDPYGGGHDVADQPAASDIVPHPRSRAAGSHLAHGVTHRRLPRRLDAVRRPGLLRRLDPARGRRAKHVAGGQRRPVHRGGHSDHGRALPVHAAEVPLPGEVPLAPELRYRALAGEPRAVAVIPIRGAPRAVLRRVLLVADATHVRIGAGSLGWMLVVGTVMAVEKNMPWGRKISTPLGVLLLGWGLAVVAFATLTTTAI